MTKQQEYSDAFIDRCKLLFQDIRENQPLKICIDRWQDTRQDPLQHPLDALWFIYYMFFAIHNPKLEEYINMKYNATTDAVDTSAANILKNMIRRRAYTSTLVFQLYTYANINKGAVTYIYPSAPIIKSLTTSHLKTAAVVIHKISRGGDTHAATVESLYNDYVTTIDNDTISPGADMRRRLSHIKYTRKDIILLSLVCYMKIEEGDINIKGLFISASNEEIMTPSPTPPTPQTPPTPPTPYDEKYKYLIT